MWGCGLLVGKQSTREVGVSFGTLEDDCRIYEAFGDEILRAEENYTRTVYRDALYAKDPRV